MLTDGEGPLHSALRAGRQAPPELGSYRAVRTVLVDALPFFNSGLCMCSERPTRCWSEEVLRLMR